MAILRRNSIDMRHAPAFSRCTSLVWEAADYKGKERLSHDRGKGIASTRFRGPLVFAQGDVEGSKMLQERTENPGRATACVALAILTVAALWLGWVGSPAPATPDRGAPP